MTSYNGGSLCRYLISANAGELDNIEGAVPVGVYFYSGVDGRPGEYYRVDKDFVQRRPTGDYLVLGEGEEEEVYPAHRLFHAEQTSISSLKKRLLQQENCWDTSQGIFAPRI